jgi:hypothetical protein
MTCSLTALCWSNKAQINKNSSYTARTEIKYSARMLNQVFIIHIRSPVNSMVGGCRVLAHGEQQREPALPAGGVQAKRLNLATRLIWPRIRQFWPAAAPPRLNIARNRTNSSGDLLKIYSSTTLACQIGGANPQPKAGQINSDSASEFSFSL